MLSTNEPFQMLFVVILCQNSYNISATIFVVVFISCFFIEFIGKENFLPTISSSSSTTSSTTTTNIVSAAAAIKGSKTAQYRGPNCDRIIQSNNTKNGTIQTPLFPAPYPIRSYCRYEFVGRGRERIQIKFFEFSLPSDGDYNCENADTLQVFLPLRGRYQSIETLCGDTIPKPIMSNGPRMLLEFRGRHSGKGNRGFKAEYKFLENFGIISGKQLNDTECSFVFNSTDGRSGWFHSPNFPGAYPRNLECNYYFNGQTNDRIFIRFTYFDVEGIFPCDETTASDYIEFSNFMTIDRKFMKFCGKREGFTIRSDGRFFRITFRTNDRFDKTGFRASYAFEFEQPTTEIVYIQQMDCAIINKIDYRIISVLCVIMHLFSGINIIL